MIRALAGLLGLSLVSGAVCSCSNPSPPALDTCCVIAPPGGTPTCFCGSSSTPGSSFTVNVSGSSCTVTSTNDGSPSVTAQGQPPAAQSDCSHPVGS
jgi:hypothetical protein